MLRLGNCFCAIRVTRLGDMGPQTFGLFVVPTCISQLDRYSDATAPPYMFCLHRIDLKSAEVINICFVYAN